MREVPNHDWSVVRRVSYSSWRASHVDYYDITPSVCIVVLSDSVTVHNYKWNRLAWDHSAHLRVVLSVHHVCMESDEHHSILVYVSLSVTILIYSKHRNNRCVIIPVLRELLPFHIQILVWCVRLKISNQHLNFFCVWIDVQLAISMLSVLSWVLPLIILL